MEFPLSLPAELNELKIAKSDQELFSILSRNTELSIRFIASVANNYTWMHDHADLIQKLLEINTKLFFEDRLSLEYARRLYTILQANYDELADFIPRNITLETTDGSVQENSLLMGVGSRVLREWIRQECRLKNQTKLVFQDAELKYLKIVLDYFHKGTFELSGVISNEFFFELFKLAKKLDVKGLALDSQQAAIRLIQKADPYEIISLILLAQQTQAWIIKKACYEAHNDLRLGMQFQFRKEEDTAVEFHDLRQATLNIYERIAPIATHLSFLRNLLDEASYPEILMSGKLIRGLGVEESERFSQRLLAIPRSITELDLTKCPWLLHNELRQIVASNPHLEKWTLSSNNHLPYNVWGDLSKASNLKALNISKCHQIGDTELKVIVKGCAGLLELDISECKNVTAKGFNEIALSTPRLRRLYVGRTSIADRELYEIGMKCSQLLELNLTRCPGITEKGLSDFLRVANQLVSLNLQHNRLDKEFLKALELKYPSINFIY